jgi:hypothetical protein
MLQKPHGTEKMVLRRSARIIFYDISGAHYRRDKIAVQQGITERDGWVYVGERDRPVSGTSQSSAPS